MCLGLGFMVLWLCGYRVMWLLGFVGNWYREGDDVCGAF